MKKKQILNNAESREFLKNYKKKKAKTWEELIFEREARDKAKERKAKKGETFSVTYTGKPVSSNQMKSEHWRTFKKRYDALKEELKILINEKEKITFQEAEVTLFHNTRLDTGNIAPMEKAFTDILVDLDFLVDDKKEFVPDVLKRWGRDLPKGTVVFQIKEIGVI